MYYISDNHIKELDDKINTILSIKDSYDNISKVHMALISELRGQIEDLNYRNDMTLKNMTKNAIEYEERIAEYDSDNMDLTAINTKLQDKVDELQHTLGLIQGETK